MKALPKVPLGPGIEPGANRRGTCTRTGVCVGPTFVAVGAPLVGVRVSVATEVEVGGTFVRVAVAGATLGSGVFVFVGGTFVVVAVAGANLGLVVEVAVAVGVFVDVGPCAETSPKVTTVAIIPAKSIENRAIFVRLFVTLTHPSELISV